MFVIVRLLDTGSSSTKERPTRLPPKQKKLGWGTRQFWAVLVRMEGRRECSDRKLVSRCRERARRVYHGDIVGAKKEIPGDGYTVHSGNPNRLGPWEAGKHNVMWPPE